MNPNSEQDSIKETIKANTENGTLNFGEEDVQESTYQAPEMSGAISDEEILEKVTKSTTNIEVIEEIKRQKITEAVQKSDVYRNLEAIHGINVRNLLHEMVEIYMQLDRETAISEFDYYIDYPILENIIQSVKVNKVDNVQNGIVTNSDGTINIYESAEQLQDMTGHPINEILASNKRDMILSERAEKFLKSEEAFESVFLNMWQENSDDADSQVYFLGAIENYAKMKENYKEIIEKDTGFKGKSKSYEDTSILNQKVDESLSKNKKMI